jgi:hypothetical protein
LDVRDTMAVRTNTTNVAAGIAAIDDGAWVDIDSTVDGQAQVAECAYTTGTGRRQVTHRLVVRRTRLTDTHQQRLWPNWRHHAFVTDLTADTVTVDRFHRHHAVVELAIRDMKEGADLEHVPSGNFHANSAWLQCAVLAHNLNPLDHPRRHRCRRPTRRWPHDADTARRDPRPARQPLRPHHLATPHPLAMGDDVHDRAQQTPTPPPGAPLTSGPRGQARRTPPPALTTTHARRQIRRGPTHQPTPIDTTNPNHGRHHHRPGSHRWIDAKSNLSWVAHTQATL